MSELTLDIEESTNGISTFPTRGGSDVEDVVNIGSVAVSVGITSPATNMATGSGSHAVPTALRSTSGNPGTGPEPEETPTEENPLTTTTPSGSRPETVDTDEDDLELPHPYLQYCYCCSQLIATKPKLFYTLCGFLSVLCAGFLSVCFFYPEQLFGLQAVQVNGFGGGGGGVGGGGVVGGKTIHHPHQNRHILASSGRRILSTSHVAGGGGRRSDDEDAEQYDEDDADASAAADGVDTVYTGPGPIFGSPYPTNIMIKGRPTSRHEPIVTFADLTQTFNYSNLIQTRLLHFDLKGAPPTVSYMREVMKLAKEAGITGLLIEWEDTFPWHGILVNTTLSHGAAYTESEVAEILEVAQQLQLDVIPLIQTFGHVEYILKGPEFFHLREDPNDPQSFCPSLKETLAVIQEMVRQIVAIHQHSKFIHIGCDEVFNIGSCPLCTGHRPSSYDPNELLFLQHVKTVAEMVKITGRIPIIWDDMLRTISHEKLKEHKLGSFVEPMVWVYAEDIDKFITGEQWAKYTQVFPTIWTAGAFKGAFGESLQIPPIIRHAENTQNWIHIVSRESPGWDYGVAGIVLTGWSRYDHFSILCEILPSSIPSLVYTSLILSTPASDSRIIKNRVFVHAISRNGNGTDVDDDKTQTGIPEALTRPRARARRSTEKKWIPHPQSLRINSAPISTFSGPSHALHLSNLGGPESSTVGSSSSLWKPSQAFMIQKFAHINADFSRILHCSFDGPILEFQLAQALQDEDSALISRCNFQGLSFYRTLLRLRVLTAEIWSLDGSLTRSRGWVTKYSQRHNYSSPFRVNELIDKEVPKLKRNLGQIGKSLGISMKKLYPGSIILEWLELNVWNVWEVLDGWERVGQQLKEVRFWGRRPLKSPQTMVHDLGLLPLQLLAGSDSGRDEL